MNAEGEVELQEGEIEITQGGYRAAGIFKPSEIEVLTCGAGMLVAATQGGTKVAYSMRNAKKAFPTYAHLFHAAAKSETDGLIDVCLQPIHRKEIITGE